MDAPHRSAIGRSAEVNGPRKTAPGSQARLDRRQRPGTLLSGSTRTTGCQHQLRRRRGADHHMPRPPSAPDTTAASTRTEPYPPWDPLFAYNNLPPVPGEQLTTRAVERHCQLATAALETLRNATTRLADPLLRVVPNGRADRGTGQLRHRGHRDRPTLGKMLEQMDRPRLTNATEHDTHDALRHYHSIIDAQRLFPASIRVWTARQRSARAFAAASSA